MYSGKNNQVRSNEWEVPDYFLNAVERRPPIHSCRMELGVLGSAQMIAQKPSTYTRGAPLRAKNEEGHLTGVPLDGSKPSC